VFTSTPVATTRPPVALTVPFATWGILVELPLYAAQITYEITPTGLVKGQINGVIPQAAIDSVLIPAMVAALNQQIQSGSSNAGAIRAIFDTTTSAPCDMGGGVTGNDMGTCGCDGANNGVIEFCEVKNSPLIKNILAPDIDAFDDMGRFAPNPQNTGKDSLSFGMGFLAVPANF
jgi:hypothetical protein